MRILSVIVGIGLAALLAACAPTTTTPTPTPAPTTLPTPILTPTTIPEVQGPVAPEASYTIEEISEAMAAMSGSGAWATFSLDSPGVMARPDSVIKAAMPDLVMAWIPDIHEKFVVVRIVTSVDEVPAPSYGQVVAFFSNQVDPIDQVKARLTALGYEVH